MKILLVGGGSGGHLTPLFAVRDAILQLTPDTKIEIWTDRKMLKVAKERLQPSSRPAESLTQNTRIRTIISGKYRRYANNPTPLKDHFANFFDLFRIVFGTIQSFCRLLFYRPDVIFLKGGFTSVPVGFAAHLLRIPYIIHESDSTLGLANRLLAKHARIVATGLPSNSNDPRFVYTGIPIDQAWLINRGVAAEGPAAGGEGDGANRGQDPELQLPSLVVLGGGLGAHSLNLEAAKLAKYFGNKVQITAIIGPAESETLESALQKLGVITHRFIANAAELAPIVRAADVVIARAGATTITELAATSRPTILVAKATLPGAHQAENAKLLAEQGAAIDYDGSTLADNQLPVFVSHLLADSTNRQSLGTKLHQLVRYDAATALAQILLKTGQPK
ncbi:MAG: glycosyltransferase [Candidatus Nomurabacteria bacterium]|jgi:UDP-N-acetylglucosamine--N-acetylmuramyl-(pentapeptide) pyrophosphoryl-undecaprenol N-acetylglucosamine transferase|nr:glycosyltransferase [Candidatus Nomurabacteria bacterium]